MSGTNRTGGPAFPESCNGAIVPGMTLRDYFAAQALATRDEQNCETWRDLAEDCYAIADAMLKERSK